MTQITDEVGGPDPTISENNVLGGMQITAKYNLTFLKATRVNGINPSKAYIYDATDTTLLASSVTLSGDDFIFNFPMTANTEYFVYMGADGANYNWSNKAMAMPVNKTNVNFNGSYYHGRGDLAPSQGKVNIFSVTTEAEASDEAVVTLASGWAGKGKPIKKEEEKQKDKIKEALMIVNGGVA